MSFEKEYFKAVEEKNRLQKAIKELEEDRINKYYLKEMQLIEECKEKLKDRKSELAKQCREEIAEKEAEVVEKAGIIIEKRNKMISKLSLEEEKIKRMENDPSDYIKEQVPKMIKELIEYIYANSIDVLLNDIFFLVFTRNDLIYHGETAMGPSGYFSIWHGDCKVTQNKEFYLLKKIFGMLKDPNEELGAERWMKEYQEMVYKIFNEFAIEKFMEDRNLCYTSTVDIKECKVPESLSSFKTEFFKIKIR